MAKSWGWTREALLALGLISVMILGLWATTGSMPPMVVVESSSMMHDSQGEVGAIDPGDLVLVMADRQRPNIISYAEAEQAGGEFEGWQSHGDLGDVIIYAKNGGLDTPVIHRVLLEAVANDTVSPTDRARQLCPEGASWDPISIDGDGLAGTCVLTWDVPGTTVLNADKIDWSFTSIACSGNPHGLMIQGWDPGHAGFLTLGDNNGCDVDQGSRAYPLSSGLTDEHGNPVEAVRSDWIVGTAGAEIPWVGAVKLAVSNNAAQVTQRAWTMLALSTGLILLATFAFEQVSDKLLSTSPEVKRDELERSTASGEEE